jgi:hypothetical protein
MSTCPKCQNPVDSQAIACPYCRMPLTAHGHPGMKLFRAEGDQPLCLTCRYHDDDTCNFPKRPTAMDCTLYQNHEAPIQASLGYSPRFRLSTWLRRNFGWIALLGLILLSVAITLLR